MKKVAIVVIPAIMLIALVSAPLWGKAMITAWMWMEWLEIEESEVEDE